MTRALRRAAAVALLGSAIGALGAGCNLLVGDYSIRDGPATAAEDDASTSGGQSGPDHREPGKSAGNASSGNDSDGQR